MSFVNAYKRIKRSIVAFTQKHERLPDKNAKPPEFPTIIGTGFVIREDGIIVTNKHVVEAFTDVPLPPDVHQDNYPVHAMIFKETEVGISYTPVEILNIGTIRGFPPEVYYGPKEGPDLAFVQAKVRGLSPVELEDGIVLEEGLEVGTSGFPMGTVALTAPGWLHQVTPTLQKGIISSILPFPCKCPHGFTINVMVQGGASGSPVFQWESGKVLGILYASLKDLCYFAINNNHYSVPLLSTNISYVVPSYYISKILKSNDLKDLKLPSDTKSLDEMIAVS